MISAERGLLSFCETFEVITEEPTALLVNFQLKKLIPGENSRQIMGDVEPNQAKLFLQLRKPTSHPTNILYKANSLDPDISFTCIKIHRLCLLSRIIWQQGLICDAPSMGLDKILCVALFLDLNHQKV
jgi:hypothetical protein